MFIREYQNSDLAALRAIHAAQSFEYALPDLSNPLFVTKLVLANELPSQDVALAHTPVTSHQSPVTEHESSSTETVLTNREGNCRILGAALLRLTSEAYLLLDPKAGTPRERWQWLLALHAAAERDAWTRGLEDVHAWLPPPIARKFGKRIERLGWIRDNAWTPYCKRLGSEHS